MLSVDREDERETARDEQETERCRPAATLARCLLKLVTRAPATCKYHRPPPGPPRVLVSRPPPVLCERTRLQYSYTVVLVAEKSVLLVLVDLVATDPRSYQRSENMAWHAKALTARAERMGR